MRLLVTTALLTGCAMHAPIVADVRCPRATRLVFSSGNHDTGRCILRDGKRHGPSYAITSHGVAIDGYDHGALAGAWARYDERGRLLRHGYRPGVTDSTEPADDLGEASYDSPATTGKLVVPANVRLVPVQGDVAFTATTLVSSQGHPTSSFLGAIVDINLPSPSRLRFRRDAYRGAFVSYGVAGATGIVARAECDDPTITGSGGFCGSRWLVGPVIRVGYARTTDARPEGAMPTLLAYGKLGFLLGQDRWSSTYSSGTELTWRLRAGAGYTALGSLLGLTAQAHGPEGWRWLLVPFVALVEHAEAYLELGGDGGNGLGIGAGVDLGFGL